MFYLVSSTLALSALFLLAELIERSRSANDLPLDEEIDALPKARKGAVGAVGFSNGGFFAMLLAATNRVKAGVSYYGALDGARTQPDLAQFSKRFSKSPSRAAWRTPSLRISR